MKIKKILMATLMAGAVITLTPGITTQVHADTPIPINVNGVRISGPSFINAQNRTMVPISLISNELGYGVNWDGNTKIAHLTNSAGRNVMVQIGNRTMFVDGTEHHMDTDPVIRQDRTMLPLNAVATALGAEVIWDAGTRTVIVNTNEQKQEVENDRQPVKLVDAMKKHREFERTQDFRVFKSENALFESREVENLLRDFIEEESDLILVIIKDDKIVTKIDNILEYDKDLPEYDIVVLTDDFRTVFMYINEEVRAYYE